MKAKEIETYINDELSRVYGGDQVTKWVTFRDGHDVWAVVILRGKAALYSPILHTSLAPYTVRDQVRRFIDGGGQRRDRSAHARRAATRPGRNVGRW